MKFRAFGFLTLLTGLAFSGCVPAANNTEVPNALVAKPNTINLTPTAPAATDVALNCGCRYKLEVTSFTGDTADIKYTSQEPLDSMLQHHHISLAASPTAATGTHTAALALHHLDDNNIHFYDTVRVTLIVP